MNSEILKDFSELSYAHRRTNESRFPLLTDALQNRLYGQKTSLLEDIFPLKEKDTFKLSAKNLFSREEYNFGKKGVRKNILGISGKNNFIFEINDLSQSAEWELPKHPWVKSISSALSDSKEAEGLCLILDKDWGSDSFSQLFRQFIFHGIFLDVPPDAKCKVEIKYDVDNDVDNLDVFHWIVNIGANSEVEWSENFASSKTSGLSSIEKRFELGDGSRLKKLFTKEKQKTGQQIHSNLFRLGEKAELHSMELSLFNQKTRFRNSALLLGEKASSSFCGLLVGSEGGFGDHSYSVQHLASDTVSDQYVKSVLDDGYKSIVNSFSTIGVGATGSDSSQLLKNLVMDKKSQVLSKPELKVYNDDVTASHGVTFGQLDPDQSFYLRCRGLSQQKAEEILLGAFLGDVFSHSKLELGEEVHDFLKRTLEELI